jgi:hypothetical protein
MAVGRDAASATTPLEAPLARLERALIEDFLRARGHDPNKLADLPDAERDRLLADASVYASGRLMEVEARSHFLDEIHDGTPGFSKTGLD